jgi:arylsulfatase
MPAAQAVSAVRPNFLVIVADDLGFSDLGAFGGEIETPNLDQLAYSGLRLTDFHTAATCSPTRAMLMSGTDHHRAGLGNMSELITPAQRGRPGYEGYLNEHVVTLAELLHDAGYRTLMSGKWHLGVQPEQDPSRRGFERVFALLDAGHNHFGRLDLPPKALGGVHYTENGKPVALPEHFYSSDFFTDKLLQYLRGDASGRPFFAYLPFSAPHWPLQAPADLIAKYRGRYDGGWVALRRARLEGQRKLGLLPPNADLTVPSTLHNWDSLSADERAKQSRKMEVYAAMVERMDWNVGRVLDYLREAGQLENTVVIVFSDNGAAPDSVIHMLRKLAGVQLPEERLDTMGSIDSVISYGPHWAQAAAAPRRLFKSVSTEGGLVTPAIIRYPAFKRQGRIDRSFATVMDVLPTLLELAGTRHPATEYRGRVVEPPLGKSMVPYLTGKSTRIHSDDESFGWELFGQRALRQGQWKITYVSAPNGSGKWELYDLFLDPGERRDVSARHPETLQSLIGKWDAYARNMGVILQEQVVSPYTDL